MQVRNGSTRMLGFEHSCCEHGVSIRHMEEHIEVKLVSYHQSDSEELLSIGSFLITERIANSSNIIPVQPRSEA